MQSEEKKYNLFVYGSLRAPHVFRSVCGLDFTVRPAGVDETTLFAELAILPSHRRVSPDNVYFYAVKARSSERIEGYVIYDVPEAAMAEIDRYEGKRYQRENVQVSTAHGPIDSVAYLVSRESMKKHFGDRFHVNLIHELWLRNRIEKFMERSTRPGDKSLDAEHERAADRELLGTTERDLVITHYGHDAISDYSLEQELQRPRPSIRHLYEDPKAQPYIRNYLGLIVKQVLFNQLEHRINTRFRFEISHLTSSERFFNRTMSVLIALEMINNNEETVDMLIRGALESMPIRKHDLFDYIKYAVSASKSFFDTRVVNAHLTRIRANIQPGLIPLGMEVEMSNVGFAAVEPQRSLEHASDPIYDDFSYFADYCMDILSWKVGGYIDDHTGRSSAKRKKGFLELAPGRLNIAGELSRPATNDPWILNGLIHAIVRFYKVDPHSLHLSFQLRKDQIKKYEVLPMGFIKCLLVLGGGLEHKRKGSGFWVSRMGHGEIVQYGSQREEFVFARRGKRKWYMGEDEVGDRAPKQATTHVQQYKFIRLDRRANYEPLIMCLKGLQLGFNPGDYLTVDQLRKSKKLRNEYEELKAWAGNPTKIAPQVISRFLKTVQEGLVNEGHHKPVHKLHYINWCLNTLSVRLNMFNQQLKKVSQ